MNKTLKSTLYRFLYILISIVVIIWITFNIIVLINHNYFVISSITALCFFVISLLVFAKILQKNFIKPMLFIIENAKQIGSITNLSRLKYTGQQDFDSLVEQINSMVSRLDENSRSLFQMQAKIKSAEFEKQQAILIG